MERIGRDIMVILGPTAGGKSGLAMELAERIPGGGEIVSADSMQVYRGMDIGTAKPTEAERERVRHHVIDVAEADEPFTVDDWRKLADGAIEEIRGRGRRPIVVGGTNLYVKVFLSGMFEGPAADAGRRAEFDAAATEDLHRLLATLDPAAAERIHRNDRKRITRALEVVEATGRPISAQQTQWDRAEAMRDDVVIVGVDWPTETINARINARVRRMISGGLVEEVRGLWEAGRLGMQAREALGYKQILAYLEGRDELESAIERIKIETRRFARKQRTWLKQLYRYQPTIVLSAAGNDTQALAAQALEFVEANRERGVEVRRTGLGRA